MLKYIFVKEPSEEINWFEFKKGDIFHISKNLIDYNLGYSINYNQNQKNMVSFMRAEVFENYKPYIILHRSYVIKKLLDEN